MPFTEQERKEFKRLVLPHLDVLHRVALHLTHQPSEAEEIVAEAIFKACGNFRRLRDKDRIKQWLLRILCNDFISLRRMKRRHQGVPFEEEWEDDAAPFSAFDGISRSLVLGSNNPEELLIQKLMDEDIKRAIGTLPEEFHLAVVLCDVEGLRYREIAHILKLPIGTVRSRLSRGRALLQKKLWHYAQDVGLLRRRKREYKEEYCTCESEKGEPQSQSVAVKH
jgi:RNA polymerase sigma factor (sigma-70 family)